MDSYINENNFLFREKLSLIYDVLCGSIETTANAIGLVLYCVTLNDEIQDKLRQEALSLPSNDSLEGKVRTEYNNC